VKAAIFHPAARDVLRSFPEEVRKELGKAIRDLQGGAKLGMPVSKPMPDVAMGAAELRVRGKDGVYRTFYYTKSSRGILIFHAFVKKTQKTASDDIELGRKRLKELLHDEI